MDTHSTPTSTGNDSEAGPGFTPQFVMMLPTMAEAASTIYWDALGGGFGISTFDDDDEYCNSINYEDEVATSNTQSLSDDKAANLPDDDGSQGVEASFVSFDANGWTLNYTAVKANAKLWPYLAIGEAAAGGGVAVSMDHYSRFRRV